MRTAGVVFVTVVAAIAVGSAQVSTRPAEILHEIQTFGARATLNALYRDDDQWTAVLRGIGGGMPEWIAVAEALKRVADAHPSESLDAAMGEALGRNAQLVLSHSAGPFALSSVCAGPDVDDERFDTLAKALAELNRRIRGVERVNDPVLARVRGDCVTALRESEGDLRRFFARQMHTR